MGQTEISLGDLIPDPKNARRHAPRNVGMIVDSLQQVGAARSIVIDEHGTILAGNATVEAAGQAGIERVQVVEADGNTLVAVRRSGLTRKQKVALALADNRTAELAEWNVEELTAIAAELPDVTDGLWDKGELEKLTAQFVIDGVDAPDLASGDRAPFQQMTFTLHDYQAEQVKAAIERAKAMGPFVESGNENSNGNALARVCEVFLGAS